MSPGQVVFFVGSHRTGSTTLARFFDEHVPDATSVHQRTRHLLLNELAGMRAAGVISQRLHDRLSRRVLVGWLEASTADRVVETNGFAYTAIAAALPRFPDAPIIHVVRDPREFIPSMARFRRRKPARRFVQLHLPFWDYGPRLPELEKLAWQWNYKSRFIDEAYGAHPRFLRLRFEDLFDDTTDTYEQMMAFIDPSLDAAALRDAFFATHLNAAGPPAPAAWTRWEPELCRHVHRTCGELMAAYGYGGEPEWLAAVGDDTG